MSLSSFVENGLSSLNYAASNYLDQGNDVIENGNDVLNGLRNILGGGNLKDNLQAIYTGAQSAYANAKGIYSSGYDLYGKGKDIYNYFKSLYNNGNLSEELFTSLLSKLQNVGDLNDLADILTGDGLEDEADALLILDLKYYKSLAEIEEEKKKDITDNTVKFDAGRFVGQNDIVKRFHLGNEFGSESSNDVFAAGYDDPTKLTFKVEFGEWGASLLTLEDIKALQRTSKLDNVSFQDYDQFPLGLLDLNFTDFAGGANWNAQTSYNAYNYLMNRNEDARANYINKFINGLYVLQKDFPYIFLKVSGLEKLQEFNTTNGKRLKDAKITFECLEGVDQKIRTLMLLYRKAAYDEVWQRWVLPDIYRYFRMIIYVFDRRILHTPAGTWSYEQDDFPIYAFECSPCEFDIEGLVENEFSVVYNELKESSSKITISVKNVKTYYSNKLFNKVEGLKNKVTWISDFDSIREANNMTTTDAMQYANFRTRWIQKMFMTPAEYKAFHDNNLIHKIGSNADKEKLSSNKDAYNPQIPNSTWHYATVTDSVYNMLSWGGLIKQLKKTTVSSNIIIRDSRFDDRDEMYNDLVHPNEDSYIYTHEPLMFGPDVYEAEDALRQRIIQMLHHMYHSYYPVNDTYYYELVDPGLMYYSPAHIRPYVRPITVKHKPLFTYISPYENISVPEQSMPEPLTDDYEYNINPVYPDSDYETPDFNMYGPEDTPYKFKMQNIRMLEPLPLPLYLLTSPLMDEHTTELLFVTPEENLEKREEFAFPELISNLETPDQYMLVLNMKPYLYKTKLQMIYNKVYKTEKPLLYLISNRVKLPKREEMPMMETEVDETKNLIKEMVTPVFDEHKVELSLIEDTQDTHKNSMSLLENPINDSYTPNKNMVTPVFSLWKRVMKMFTYTPTDNKVESVALFENKVEPEKLIKMNMFSNFIDNVKNKKMNMFLNPVNATKQQMDNLLNTSAYQDTFKGPMQLMRDTHDEHKETHNMWIDPHDEHKEKHNLWVDPHDTFKASLSLVPDFNIPHKQHVTPLVPDNVKATAVNQDTMYSYEYNEFKPDMLLQMLDTNAIYDIKNPMQEQFIQGDIPEMDLQSNITKTSLPDNELKKIPFNSNAPEEMDMVSNDVAIKTPEYMNMQSVNNDVYTTDMELQGVNTNVKYDVDFNMNPLNANPYKVEMDMQENKGTDVKIDMDMLSMVIDSSHPIMDMAHLVLNTSIPLMDMAELSINDDKTKMIMQSIDSSTEPATIVDMVMPNSSVYTTNMQFTYLNQDGEHTLLKMEHIPDTSYDSKMDMVENYVDVSLNSMLMMHIYNEEYNTEMVMTRTSNDASISDMAMIKMSNTVSEPNEMKMIIPNTSINKTVMKDMVSTVNNDSVRNMEMINNYADSSINGMVMISVDTKPSKLSEMEMIHTVLNEYLYDASMVVMDVNAEKTAMDDLVKYQFNEEKTKLKMDNVIINSSVDVEINPVTIDQNTEHNESFKMNGLEVNADTPYMDLVHALINDEKPEMMKMINITDSPALIQKIEALTSIDTDDLKNIGTDEMLSLANIIESTYDELKERLDKIKLLDNKPNIPKHEHMKMTRIILPERNLFIVKKLHKVDQEAIDRAWAAKQNADSDRNGDRTSGTSGYAL